jgi:hypothetical protein
MSAGLVREPSLTNRYEPSRRARRKDERRFSRALVDLGALRWQQSEHPLASAPVRSRPATLDTVGGELLDPAELLHGPAGVPDLGHVADLAVLELHHVDVVGAGALAGRGHRAALAAVGA